MVGTRRHRLVQLSLFVMLVTRGVCLAAQDGGTQPRGSAAAVRAFHESFPRAVLDQVMVPKDLGGASKGDTPLYWLFRFHVGDAKQEASITPDGIVIRTHTNVEAANLPGAIAVALHREAGSAKVTSIERQEIRATLKYVALARPNVSYVADVEKGGHTVHLTFGADGAVRDRRSGMPSENEEESAAAEHGSAPSKEIPIPPEAAKAVRAVKKVYPNAVVQKIEDVGYDDGSGHMGVAYYEVEFPLNGKEKEAHATPDGIMVDLERPVEIGALPATAATALRREAAGGSVKTIRRMEILAGMKFVRLSRARIVYVVGCEVKGQRSTLRLAADGSRIKVFDPKTWSMK